LIGPRIVLRPYRLADTQAVWEAIDESRASLERWVPDIGCRRTPSDVRIGLESLLSDSRDRQIFAICDRAGGGILGEVGLYSVDWPNGCGEIGYWLRETARQRGYMAEALQLVIGHATHGLGLRRLEAHIAPDNTYSVRSVERQGFRVDRPRAPMAGLDAVAASIVIYAREHRGTRGDRHGAQRRP
jgi:ribosomal-protein-alanine N-acetyltransferase